jgi:hypothetical protein
MDRQERMNTLLRDLYEHQARADAEHWRAIEKHPPAREDAAIRNRLHHLHLVQRLFIWAVGRSGERVRLQQAGRLRNL